MSTSVELIQDLAAREYKYGFVTEIEQDAAPRGLSEEIVRLISAKKHEPAWLLEWRLKAYRIWLSMKEPTWGNVKYGPIDYQDIIYYAAPKRKPALQSLEEVDPEIRRTFEEKLLAWLPGPSSGAGKVFAWLWICLGAITLLAAILIGGDIGDVFKRSPYATLMSWSADSVFAALGGGKGALPYLGGAAYFVLVGYGFATIIGKKLEH